ncbi:MAG: patatin-like phospholipase family protein [Longimicrobiales bacterium]
MSNRGEKVVLVLGGGGIKGMAHIGACQAIREAGIEVSEIVGTSIGGLVGATLAGGDSVEVLHQKALELKRANLVTVNRWAVLLNGIRQQSLFRGDVFTSYVESVLPVDSFAELSMPVTMNAVDLATGETVWLGAGGDSSVSITTAVVASCALPVFYPPVELNGRFLVDGGVNDNLPIVFAAERGADRIIAIDVGAGIDNDAEKIVGQGMVAIHHRVVEIMGYPRKLQRLASWQGPPMIYVRPRIEGYSTFEFGRTDFFIEEGYRATKEALARGPESSATLRRFEA